MRAIVSGFATDTQKRIENRLRGKRNRSQGLHAEQMVLTALRHAGIEAVKLETPWRVKRARSETGASKIIGATPQSKVLADIVGVHRTTGRAVLVEVKREDAPTLAWSRLDAHQVVNLDRWHGAGALCYVAWVRGLHARLIPWRHAQPPWGPGTSVPWDSPHLHALI